MNSRASLRRVAAFAFLLGALAGSPARGQEKDGLGQPLRTETRKLHDSLLAELKGRRLTDLEKDFLLTLLNQPELDSGPFKKRGALVRHFIQAGAAVSDPAGSGLADTDMWRLVRAVRAASHAFRIPPAVLLCLTFRESSFNPRASAWTTSAKGVGQLTNATVQETVKQIHSRADLREAAELYVGTLSEETGEQVAMPREVVGAPEVDRLTREIAELERQGAPPSVVNGKKQARRKAISSHKDEPGHIYNLETNFGLGAAYLAYIRYYRFPEVPDPRKGWLTAVGAYNQGPGVLNDLIYKVLGGPPDYNRESVERLFHMDTLRRLSLPTERQKELYDEVSSVDRCASP